MTLQLFVDTTHIQNIQVAAKELGDEITDGASAVSDDSGALISTGTDTIRNTIMDVSSIVSKLNSYLDNVATTFQEADASIANSISKGGVVESYGKPKNDTTATSPTDGEKAAADGLP
jgi:hypothetical protein